MSEVFDTLLLMALPASGKSEVRNFLQNLPPEVSEKEFHIGAGVQLDDFPYVHLMRRIDDELQAMGKPRVYFPDPDKSFGDGRDWGTLMQLINLDYDELVAGKIPETDAAATLLFERLDEASTKVGCDRRMAALDDALRGKLAQKMEKDAQDWLAEKRKNLQDNLNGKTVVIEFARGGPDGASMPLPAPLGYRYSLAQLSDKILSSAAILYIWVTPEESRRKNDARTDPNDPGSILNHGVPMHVMLNDYGCDDIDDLLGSSSKPGTIEVRRDGKSHFLPLVRFDNRVDKTSFLRDDPKDWPADKVQQIHSVLSRSCQDAFALYR